MKLLASLPLLVASTVVLADGTTVSEKDYQLPKCAKPIASVMVGKIACKANSCQAPAASTAGANSGLLALAQLAQAQAGGQGQQANFVGIGEGMAAMLTTALRETQCFDIQEREALDDVSKELALVGKKVEVQQADFMISGSITSIDMTTSKSTLGGGLIPVVGMFSKTTKTADLAMDIKVIDINRAKVVEAKTFVGNNETSSTSFGGAAFVGVGLIGGSMSTIRGTPMEGIVRDVLARAASFSATRLLEAKGVTTGAVTTAPIVASN